MNPTAEASDRCLRRDAQENRQRILDSAREAFARDGLDVSMVEIARLAGVGNATVHRNFTKETLVEALFDDWFERHRIAGERALEDPYPWHGLTVFLEQVLSDASRNRALLDMFMIRLHRGDVASAPISRLLRRAQESGDVRTDVSLEDMFLIFWGFGRTLNITGDAAPEQWRRQLALMLDGIRLRSGQAPLPGEAISHEKLDGLIADWAQDAVGRCRGSGGC
jgi:AcrR family transcriptional regulator